ncbi:MAG: TonB-dependent receptor [Terriglobia bacterium]
MRFVTLALFLAPILATAGGISGHVTDPQGRAVPGATVSVLRRSDSTRRQATAGTAGEYVIPALEAGEYRLTSEAKGFPATTRTVMVGPGEVQLDLQFASVSSRTESLTVSADVSDVGLFAPDPAQRILVREETLDANPGRPGMPISIPGMPVESPAGGVKPPQYFVPGVAGDHGEPIAMFFQIGGLLYPNNLPANARGNGYADPNVIIPITIENVQTDGAAFNVREGNNSVNAAIVLGLRDRLDPVVRLTADYRDLNLVLGWSPADPANKSWIGFEVSYGNGFLKRLEHRRQYKGNLSKVFTLGNHQLTVYGIGYYGFAFQPGLIPIDTSVPDDTIDLRQREETSNGSLILNDIWHLTPRRQFQLSGFYRYYTLDVRPNFGDGWIRQSEHRNVNSEDVLYADNFGKAFSLMGGVNFRREAPRALDLDKADAAGAFQPVTANNVTLNFYSPFVAVDGSLFRYLHYNLGYRRDDVNFDNQDIYRPSFSFNRHAGINSPKGTLSLRLPGFLPAFSLSYGQAFHINDPRIGTTAVMGGTIVSKARSYQLVISKTTAFAEFRATLAHVTTAQQLARISNDTGLQEDEGPGLIKSLTLTARFNGRHGFLQALYARADARDRVTGEPTPEAPRLIWDLLATVDKLPFHLVTCGEYEYVGRKPLGDGFVSTPIREFRAAILRPFESFGIDVGLNLFLASGYGGQTLEALSLPGKGSPSNESPGFRCVLMPQFR